jgi:hypothetical protein
MRLAKLISSFCPMDDRITMRHIFRVMSRVS